MFKINQIISKKLLVFIGVLFTIFPLYAQSYPEPEFSEKFLKNLKSEFTTYEDQYERGKKILEVSSSDAEFARSYGNMGYAKYMMYEYSEAIPLMEKAKEFAYKGNYVRFMFGMNTALKDAYRSVGMQQKSDECWKEAQRIAQKYNNFSFNFTIYDIKAKGLEREKKYADAVLYYKKQAELIKDDQKNVLTLASINAAIAYDYLKINNSTEARSYLDKATPPIENEKIKSEVQELEIFYLAKGILAFHDRNDHDTKKWFRLALDEAKQRNNKESFLLVTEELMNTNIGFLDDKLVFEEYSKTINLKTDEILKVINKAENEGNAQIKKRSTLLQLLTGFMIIGIFPLLYYNRRRNKKVKIQLESIMKELEEHRTKKTEKNDDSFEIKDDLKVSDCTEPEPEKDSNRIMSPEKEEELLEKLQIFENGTEFTSLNFAFSNFISILESNSKYANYIVKQHRQKSFNEYINGLRIQFVVQKLYDNKEYLNYKISYLAEIGGFSSHSSFARAFKKELQLSPSEFINQLQKRT